MRIWRIMITTALAVVIAMFAIGRSSAQVSLQLTATNLEVSVQTTGSNSNTPPSHGSAPGGGSGYICPKDGAPISTHVNSQGYLTISYSGSSSDTQAILAYQRYASCVTTAQQQQSRHCISSSPFNQIRGASCTTKLTTVPVKWTIPGRGSGVGGSTSVQGAINQCTVQLDNPVVYVPKPSIASMQFYPQHNWLLNLPVEYKYTDGSTPQPSLQGKLTANCPVSIPWTSSDVGSTPHPNIKGHKYLYTSISSGANGSANLSVGGLAVNSVHKGSAQVAMVLADNPSQVVESSLACPHSTILISPSQLPNYQGKLSSYAVFYQKRKICTVIPTSANFQSVAINKQAIMFELNQEWTFSTSYSIHGYVYTDYYGSEVAHYSGRVTRTISQYNTPQTIPYNGGTYSQSINVESNEYKSGPIAVNYIAGRECSVVNGTITCPTS